MFPDGKEVGIHLYSEVTAFTHNSLFETLSGALVCNPLKRILDQARTRIHLKNEEERALYKLPSHSVFTTGFLSFLRLAKLGRTIEGEELPHQLCPICKQWPEVLIVDGTTLRNKNFPKACSNAGIKPFGYPKAGEEVTRAVSTFHLIPNTEHRGKLRTYLKQWWKFIRKGKPLKRNCPTNAEIKELIGNTDVKRLLKTFQLPGNRVDEVKY